MNSKDSTFSGMTKKTMYFSEISIAKDEAVENWSDNMEHTVWQQFMLRDDYCPERELSDEQRHQFVSLSIALSDYVSELSKSDQDKIRYACTDLDNNQWVEVIIENTTKMRIDEFFTNQINGESKLEGNRTKYPFQQ